MFVIDHWPFALLSLATVVISVALARCAWRRRTVAGATEFAWLMLAVAWISVASIADTLLSTRALTLKLLANQLYVVGGAAAALLLFLFAVRYTHRDHWLTRNRVILLWSLVALDAILILTNPWHHRYWPAIYVDPVDPTAPLVFTYSLLYRVLVLYTYGLAVLAAILIFYHGLRAPTIYRPQNAILIMALAAPVLTNLVYYLGAGPWRNFDFTPLSYSISGLLMAWAIFRHQFLDLAPLAHDALFAHLGDGVIAANTHRQIVAANPMAQRLLAEDEAGLIGQTLAKLPAPYSAAFITALDSTDVTEVCVRDKSIAVTHSTLTTPHGQQVGHILLLHDVTAYRVLQNNLVQLNSELEQRVAARTSELEQTVAHLRSEIEERQRIENALRHMQESLADHVTGLSSHLSVLYEVILLGGRALDIDSVRRLTLETVENALHTDAGFLLNYLPAGQRFEVAVQRGLADAQTTRLVQEARDWLLSDPVPRTILGLPDADDVPDAIRVPGMQACIITTIFHMGAPVGALGVYWREQPALSVEQIALFRALGDQLAVLAENVRLRQAHDQALVQEERQRIARDLHDSVTQSLYALSLGADTAADRIRRGQTDHLGALMTQISTAAHQALREIRLLLYELRLATPEAMPLAEALQVRLDAVERRAGIDARLEIMEGVLLPETSTRHLYWIVIEALNNALKHAAATQVTVRLAAVDAMFVLTVTDDGIGIASPATTYGFGLRNMAERAAQIGGELTVRTPPGGGAEICVCWPTRNEAPDIATTHRTLHTSP
ncbi:MAG TPA: PAS domain-containing protein [Chloroflexi bacterium]|nr:PAS domain-containing protein [Chloroflexota bacterium]